MASWLPASLASLLPGKPAEEAITVSELWIFPIKSCKGIRVESADVLPRGLRYDREFVIVEESTHRFLTARTIPKMILIETAIDFETEILSITIPATDSAPSSTHTIPLARPNPSSFDGEVLNDVSIWIHRGLDGYSVGSDALRADLSAYMGREVLLVQKGEDLRSVKPDHVLRLPNAQFEYEDEPQVSWADEYPVLIVSRTSLAELDRRIKTDTGLHTAQAKRFNTERWLSSGKGIEVVRFRGNVVLDGVAKPWDEDSWGEIVVGDDKTSLLVAQRCARCQLPSVDPDTAIRDPVVPDMVMQDRHQSFETPQKVCFGCQCVPKQKLSRISVGDRVVVTRRWEEQRSDGTPIRPEDEEGDSR